MKLDYERIGTRIKEKRRKVGISQAQLAETVFLSAKYISQIERGVRHLSLDAIAEIAVALDTSVDMLLFDKRYLAIEKILRKRKTFSDYNKNEQELIMEILSAIEAILHSYKINL